MKYQEIVNTIISEEFEMHILDPNGMPDEVREQLKQQHETVVGFNLFQIKAISKITELLYRKYTGYISEYIALERSRYVCS